jgi:hypothetical protein
VTRSEQEVVEALNGPFDAPLSVWKGHTCQVDADRPKTLREWAKHYVALKLSRGYTVADAKAETCQGYGCACEPGYEISHGIITVGPMARKWKEKDYPGAFSFAEIAREVEVGAEPDLFAGVLL